MAERKGIKIVKKLRKHKEYGEFLFRIQQEKMKELWDNEYDNAWEKAFLSAEKEAGIKPAGGWDSKIPENKKKR